MDRHLRRNRHAFTLTEILVVCGIIGVLMALLFPALARVRAQSVQLQCASNLRSWGQAFHEYAVENHGMLPHSQDESDNPFPTAWTHNAAYPENECSYIDVLPPLMSRPAWSSFADYQKPTGDIWQCPIAQVLTDDAYNSWSPSQHGYHSYAMNQYLDTGPLPYYPPFLLLARCRHPSVTLLMFETTLIPNQASNQNPISIDCYAGCHPDSNPRDLGDRHPHQRGKLGGNLLMLDGHVEWTDSLWDPTLPVPYRPPVTTQMWWPWTKY